MNTHSAFAGPMTQSRSGDSARRQRQQFALSTLARELVMALTGLFLCGVLVVHLAGNPLLLRGDGGVALTAYAELMSSRLLIRILEVGLLLGFLVHIVDAALLAWYNHASRPQRYAAASGAIQVML